MLLEALEILQSAGQDQDTFVTDFGIYKVICILTVYIPLVISTFLFSQEYLGDKIACFAPDNFTDAQAEATKEYCWNNGYWISEDIPYTKSLYTQPHRFYPLYLPIQAVIMMIPVVFWNIWTKTKVLAILRGTEKFLVELQDLLAKDATDHEKLVSSAREHIKQFHATCVSAARTSNLAKLGICRVTLELFLTIFVLILQFFIYNHKTKEYICLIPDLHGERIECTVPILDLLDLIWSINISALFLALLMNLYLLWWLYKMHFTEFQPLFYNNLPYGDTDDFNERVIWDSRWTKDSYRLLTRIFQENNSIMTKIYTLMAMKTSEAEDMGTVSATEYATVRAKTGTLSAGWEAARGRVIRRRVISSNGDQPTGQNYVYSKGELTEGLAGQQL